MRKAHFTLGAVNSLLQRQTEQWDVSVLDISIRRIRHIHLTTLKTPHKGALIELELRVKKKTAGVCNLGHTLLQSEHMYPRCRLFTCKPEKPQLKAVSTRNTFPPYDSTGECGLHLKYF